MPNAELVLTLPSDPVVSSTKKINRALLGIGKTTDKVGKKLAALGGGLSRKLGGIGKSSETASRKVDKLGDSAGQAQGKLRSLGDSFGSAGGKAGKLGESASRSGRKVKETGGIFDGVGRKVRSMAAGLLLATTAFFGISAGINQLRGGVTAAITLESIENALKVVAGSAIGGAEALAFVRSESDRLGLSLGPTASEFSKFSAAAIGSKLAGQGVRDVFSAVSEAGARLSLSSEQQAGALLALGQIMSKGCHAKGTLIRMHNGQTRLVERVKVGDYLMGPDGKPRKVLRLAHGREKMYRVVPAKGKGKPFVVNAGHLMRLEHAGEARTISLSDYLLMTPEDQERWKQRHTSMAPVRRANE